MKGWILYSKTRDEISDQDHGVRRLLEAAMAQDIELDVLTPNQFELVVSRDDKESILVDGKPTLPPDFLIPRLGSNSTYFSLAIIRQLERLGVYSCNTSKTIEIVKDKLQMHQLIAQSNLPTPKTILVKFPVNIDVVKNEIGFPIIVKNVTGSEGNGIYLCESENNFTDLMELIYSNNQKANIIIQEFVQKSRGKDLRVFVLGGKVIGCMKRFSKSSFKANFSRGGHVDPFKRNADIDWLATETARLVGLDIAGIDLLFDKKGYKICEANSSPGFKGLEIIVGKNVAEQILDYTAYKVQGRPQYKAKE